MIKKIVFATDLGAYSSHALLHVEQLAKRFDALVYFVHAVPPLGAFASAVVRSHCSEDVKKEVLQTPHIKGLLGVIKHEVYDLLLSEHLHEGDLAERTRDIIVKPGNPAAVILDEATAISADLIVIGSHGTDALDSRLLGSVAAKVLQLSKIPVFLIPMMTSSSIRGMSFQESENERRRW